MQYRQNIRNGDTLSVLGFGCMRFPKDEAEIERELIYAIEHGVNYFDTAYIYSKSEAILGRILAKGYRDRVNIATKLPPYLIKKPKDMEDIFQTQLSRLQTDHIDYYLIHMLLNVGEWQRLQGLGILDWLAEKKETGQIRNLGFSYHGGLPEFKALVDAYDWEFCMLQYNYYDETNQAGREGLQYAHQKGVPVMIMEPLRGGKLVNKLPQEALRVWEQAGKDRSPAEWALRWVWNHEEVLTVLSGMNSQEMLEENIRIASLAHPNELTAAELDLFDEVKSILQQSLLVPCTGCNYCMPCPHNVDIPLCFSCYNDTAIDGRLKAMFNYIIRGHRHQAGLCKRCGKCEQHCPQNIAIGEKLAAASSQLERFPYTLTAAIVKRFMRLS